MDFLVLKRFFCFVFLCFSLSSTVLAQNKATEIEIGGVLYHLRELYDGKRGSYGIRNYLKPVFLVTHQGWLGGYFKNSHQRNSYILGVRGYWPSFQHHELAIRPGYSAGMVTGYCRGIGYDLYDDCSLGRKWQLVPYGQLFVKFQKDNVSLNVGYSIVLTYLTLSFFVS